MRQIRWGLCFLAVSLPAFSQTYEIVNQNSGLVLDVQGQSTSDGALIQQWSFWGGQNQLWKLVPVDGESYEIVSVLSGKVLDVQGASTSQGALIQQYDYLGGGNQQWRLVPLGNGYYKIVSVLSSMVLDVQGASTSNGALLQQWPFGGGSNQQWQLLAYTQAAPVNVSVTPSSGAVSPQTFEFTASSTNGYMDIGWYQIIFNSSLSASNGCYLWYTQNGDWISMADVTNSYWVGSGGLGSTGTLSNGLCQLNLGTSSRDVSGNSITLSLAMTFMPSFAGAKNVYLATGEANTGIGTGWQQMGTWTAPGGPVYQGWLDQVSCTTISGWAWNASQPNAAQTVNFYVDGNAWPAFSAAANQFRQDLVNAGYGTGYYGYSFATPIWLQDGNTHTVDARYGTTGVELSGSPKTPQCGTGPVQYYLTTSNRGNGSISPVSGYYPAGQITVTATPYANSGAVFAGFSGALTGTASSQTLILTGDMSVTANFTTSAATNAVASTPSILPFTVDGTTCAGGMCTFAPAGTHTLATTPTSAPTRGPAPGFIFSTTDGSMASQAIAAPLGSGGSWVASGGGTVSCPPPVGTAQAAPIISSVSLDAPGQVPAVMAPGVQTTIYINGSNFGTAAGFATFCVPGGSPCDFSKVISFSYSVVSWNNNQVALSVTMDPNTQTGLWLVYLSATFWISGSDWLNPSMGNFEMEAAPTLMITNTISGANVTNTTQNVLVSQWIDLKAVVLNAAGVTPTFQWTQPPGETAIDYIDTADTSTAALVPLTGDLSSAYIAFAWTDTSGTGQPISVTATMPDGTKLTAQVTYNITVPSITVPPAPEMAAMASQNCTTYAGQWALCIGSSGQPGIAFDAQSSCANSYVNCEWMQVINSGSYASVPPSGQACAISPQTALDGTGPQGGGWQNFGPVVNDSPGTSLDAPYQEQTDSVSFSTFLMYRVNSKQNQQDGVFVPVWEIDWQWNGDATSVSGGSWTLASGSQATTIAGHATSNYPLWNSQFVVTDNVTCAVPLLSGIVVTPSQISSGGSASIALTLNGVAPANGAAVQLQSSSSAFAPQAICTVPAGQTTTTCSGTAGNVGSSTPVTVAARYYNSQQTANLTVVPPQ